jgi:hypothetical protein
MPQAKEVLIGMADGDHVLLRNWQTAPEEWTYADAEICCGPWRGKIRVAFYSDQLTRFAEAIRTLYQDLRGKAELHLLDTPFALVLTGNVRGGVVVEGYAQADSSTDTKLHFQFVIDQTFLPKIADGLAAAES